MLQISSDCISCGACAAECPAYSIELVEGTPRMISESCIRCGHCEAVCPVHALYLETLPHEDILEYRDYPTIDWAAAELFLRSRRSIRTWSKEPVTEEETRQLLDIGRYAQTGGNSQKVSYLVVSSKELVEEVRNLTLSFYKHQEDPDLRRRYDAFVNSKRDRLFRDAPMLIFALTPKGNDYVSQNPRFCLNYIELYAPTLGLATCWAGYLERYTRSDPPELRKLLDIPEDMVATGALLYGKPAYRYYRTVSRNELKMYWR